LVQSHADTVDSHTQELANLKEQYVTAVAASESKDNAHKADLETLKTTHAKNLDEAHDRAITSAHATHAVELKQLQEDHTTVIDALKKEYTASQAASSADTEKLKVRSPLHALDCRELI
jgi:hypothetical protein